jgi:hypothetical protein
MSCVAIGTLKMSLNIASNAYKMIVLSRVPVIVRAAPAGDSLITPGTRRLRNGRINMLGLASVDNMSPSIPHPVPVRKQRRHVCVVVPPPPPSRRLRADAIEAAEAC